MNNRRDEEGLVTALKESEKRKEIIEEVDKLAKEWPNLELPKQAERRDSALCHIALLAEQDRKLCIKHLAEAGIVAFRDALEKVKSHVKALGTDKEEIPLINYAPDLTFISPTQDFLNDVAYVAVPVNIIVSNKVEMVNYLVTSEREKIRLHEEELLKMRLYTDRKPYLNMPRWSEKSIKSFLSNGNKPNISEIYNDIYQLCIRYIDFGNIAWAKYLSVWIIGTYYQRIFETYPYIHLNGDMESGKTKTLMFTAWLAFNGELTFNSSPSYVVRAVHNNHSTCCIDEVERLRHSDDQDSQVLISMLNSGYKKGSFCGKSEQVDKNGQWIPRQFEAYSPKMFASIRGLEPSLSSRCMPIIMLKTGNKEIKNRELSSNDPNFQLIRDKLYNVMLTDFMSIKIFYQTLKDEEILGREWELCKPILTIAKVIDTDSEGESKLYEEIRNHVLEVQRLKKEARIEETTTPKVLKVLKESLSNCICPNPDNFWPVMDLIQFLKDSGEEEFTWLEEDKRHNKGRWLGEALRKAGIVEGRAEQRKIEGRNTKGFRIILEKIEGRLKNYEV